MVKTKESLLLAAYEKERNERVRLAALYATLSLAEIRECYASRAPRRRFFLSRRRGIAALIRQDEEGFALRRAWAVSNENVKGQV